MYNAYKDTNIGKEEKNKLFNVLETLEKDPRSYDFLVPVDYIGIFIFYFSIRIDWLSNNCKKTDGFRNIEI